MYLSPRTSLLVLSFLFTSSAPLRAEVYTLPAVDDGTVRLADNTTVIIGGVEYPPIDFLYNGKDGFSTSPVSYLRETTLITRHYKDLFLAGYNGPQFVSLLDFDLSSIPAGEQIVSARLELQYKNYYPDEGFETIVNLSAYSGDGNVALADLDLPSVPLASGVMVDFNGLTNSEIQQLSGNVYSLPVDIATLTAFHQSNQILGIVMSPEEYQFSLSGLDSFTATSTEDPSPGAIGPKLVIETLPVAAPVVEIDAVVGSSQNVVSFRGFIQLTTVGLKSSDTFDATTTDHSSVLLGDPALIDGANPVGTPVGPLFRLNFDYDFDGDNDVVYFFNVRAMRRQNAISINSTELTLRGSTTIGDAFEATDFVVISQ